jgi:cytochrome c oxidase cbb3-type subunit 3
MIRKIYKSTFLLLLLGLQGTMAFAQNADPATAETAADPSQQFIWLMMTTLLVVAVICLVLAGTVLVFVMDMKKKALLEAGMEAHANKPFFSWKGFSRSITKAVPVDREETIDLGHNYDGIRELDNSLPPWWVGMFYGSIVFAVAYMGYFHVLGGPSSKDEYDTSMAKAEIQKTAYLKNAANLVDETNVAFLDDPTTMAAGRKVFESNCTPCHGTAGEGNSIGPNLTDTHWLHGGGITNIFTTIKYGVPEKGMISWESQLPPSEMQAVSSYIWSLQGSNPPNPKEPQGDVWTPEPAPADDAGTGEGGDAPAVETPAEADAAAADSPADSSVPGSEQ